MKFSRAFYTRQRLGAPAVREAASRGWRRGQNRQPGERHGAVLGTARGGGVEGQSPRLIPRCGKQRAGIGAAVKTGSRESGAGRFWAPQGEAGSRGRAPDVSHGAGNSEQGLAPRSKPAARRAARGGFGHRKGRRGRGAEPRRIPQDAKNSRALPTIPFTCFLTS